MIVENKKSEKKVLKKIWDKVLEMEDPYLTYKDQGGFRSRPMHVISNELTGPEIHFFSSAKNEDYLNDKIPRDVTVNFKKDKDYLVLRGRATTSRDSQEIKKFWEEDTDDWFPNEEDKKNVCLIKVQINEGEMWQSISSGLTRKLEILKSRLLSRKPKLSEKFNFSFSNPIKV